MLEALRSARGRGRDGLDAEALDKLNLAISALEADGGVPDPTNRPEIDGKWRLLYTSRPGSASPIQRAFTGVEAFSIFQEVALFGNGRSSSSSSSSDGKPRVNNIVDFGPRVGYLIVQSEASTEAAPLAGFTPRAGEGLPFGIMGRSSNRPPARPNSRIDFQVGWGGRVVCKGAAAVRARAWRQRQAVGSAVQRHLPLRPLTKPHHHPYPPKQTHPPTHHSLTRPRSTSPSCPSRSPTPCRSACSATSARAGSTTRT